MSAGHQPRVLVLFARHGTARYADAHLRLRDLFARRLPEVALDLLIVDNAPGRPAPAAGERIVAGSNGAWEFSAWDDAAAHAGAGKAGHDFVALATSAFERYDTAHLERLSAPMLAAMRGRRVALGHIDAFNQPVEAFGIGLQAWLRSSFVLLPPDELRGLGSTVTAGPQAPLFSGDPAQPFRADAPVSPAYRALIHGWLTGDGTGQGVAWHSRFVLSAGTLPYYEAKARAILNEQMLTARLQQRGCRPVDLTWLADELEKGTVPAEVPDWRVQVAPRLPALARP